MPKGYFSVVDLIFKVDSNVDDNDGDIVLAAVS
jgi:hypothetical protein